ncbi:MAG: YraN family protein [Chitinophagia bacterium]
MSQHNKYTGFLGENKAADYLISLGYTILFRNWRYKHLEIDLIASKGKCLHIIEVKTRRTSTYGFPEQHIDAQKMQHLKNGAALFQYQYPSWKMIQFDVIAIQLYAEDKWDLFFIEDVYF